MDLRATTLTPILTMSIDIDANTAHGVHGVVELLAVGSTGHAQVERVVAMSMLGVHPLAMDGAASTHQRKSIKFRSLLARHDVMVVEEPGRRRCHTVPITPTVTGTVMSNRTLL